MNERAPFTPEDLYELGELFALADRVVPMRDVAKGDTGPGTIGLRHDVDDNAGSLDTALRLGEWEFERGIASVRFVNLCRGYRHGSSRFRSRHMG